MSGIDMDDVDRSKRTLSTSSRSVKRAKTEHDDTKLDCRTPRPLPPSAPRGVERVRLPASLNVNRLSSQQLEQLARARTEILHGQGRRVVGLPVVLDDGIVLNWVRRNSGSAHKVDDIPFVVRQTNASPAEHKDKNLHSSLVSAEFEKLSPVDVAEGSGASAADAIIIDSDEDTSGFSPPSRTVMPRELPVNHDASINHHVMDYSDSDIELLSPVRPENRADNQEASSRPPLLPNARASSLKDVVDIMTPDPPPTCTLTREEVAVALFEPRPEGTDVVTSDFEADETDEAEDIDCSRISARHAKSPPLPSLQPIRDLLARRKRRDEPDRGDLSGGTIIAPQVSPILPEEAPAIASDERDGESDLQTSDLQLKRVPLPKTEHGRARRLLVPDSVDLPLVAVTMRGDCHFIERKEKYRITGYSLPNPGIFRHVADVCMVGNTAVLGCDKGTDQISFLSVAGKPQMIGVTCSPHSSGPRYQDTQRRGVRCLAAIHAKGGHIKFLSGGYDGAVYEWVAGVENLDEPRSRKVVSHDACIMALAYRDRDRSIVVSAQKKLHVTDLNRCKTMIHPFSNDVQQIHIHPQAAYVTLLEVRHLDHQVQLYDSRKANFDGEPCLSFGYRNTKSKFPATHTRGSVHLVHFAQASEDGRVLLWDFRNVKRAVVERRFQQAEKVVHTVFADRDIATFGQNVVTFFEDYLVK